jgi:hypothetical protein
MQARYWGKLLQHEENHDKEMYAEHDLDKKVFVTKKH